MSEAARERPNFVIVHGHDAGRHFGPYGRGVETPNVARLAETGVVFENAFTPAPQCSPSRAALTTGCYPHRAGMLGLAHLGWSLSQPGLALPAVLRAGGYSTHLFGEQHEAHDPSELGYEEAHATEWPQLARRVADAFARRLPDIGRDRPFFASVGFFEAHRPFDGDGYRDDSPDDVQLPHYLPSSYEVRRDVAALNGRIKAVDDGLGVIMRALRQSGREADTVVVFTTDHGLAFPRAKGTLYDPGIETALVMSGPGTGSPGRRCGELVANIDLYPTLLGLAGMRPHGGIDGRSLLPWLTGAGPGPRDELFCEMTWHDRWAPVRGLRTGRWKYVRRFGPPGEPLYLPADVEESPSGRAFRELAGNMSAGEELFDLSADPHEVDNLAAKGLRQGDAPEAEAAAALEELRGRVEAWMHATADPLLEASEG